jgi:hypothetical protein
MATGQKTGHSQILIKIRPVKICPVPKDLKMAALLNRAMPQTRVPRQRHDDGPTVHQINRQGFLSD